MIRNAIPLSTIILMLCPLSVRADGPKVTLTYKAKAGESARYKSEGTLNMEAAGQKIAVELKEVEKSSISQVAANGDITMEHETESSETSVNGQKIPRPTDEHDRTTITIRKDGTLVSYKLNKPDADKDHTQARLFVATTAVFSDKAVGTGDKWTHDYKPDSDTGTRAAHADFEVLAQEKRGDVDTLKLKMSFKESEGSPALTCSGTVWVEASSGDPVASDFEIDNLKMDMGGQEVTASGKVHAERLSGGPLGGKPGDPKAEKKDKTIDEVVKDYERLPGIFTVYRKRESGRETVYLEIKEHQLDKLMLMQVTASTGTSDFVVAGDPINDIVFKFTKSQDERIYLTVPNLNFRAPEKTPIERAVRRSFADGILEAFKIEANQADRKSLLINISDLFRGDIGEISAHFQSGGGRGGYSMDRDKTFYASIKCMPENLVVQTQYHFTRSGPGPTGIAALLAGTTLADSRSIPFRVSYNLFAIPENGYYPRRADARVGYFTTDYEAFGIDKVDDPQVHYIERWQLEKADPKAALSPPKKPIVFWIDNAIPEEYRDAVREGILMWNPAFEKIGFKNAIEVKQMPDNADWDHADLRYNTIRWVTSTWQGGAYAVALFRANPITGQILNANITVDANYARAVYLERSNLVEPAAAFRQALEPRPIGLDPRLCDRSAGAMEQGWFGLTALNLLDPSFAGEKEYMRAYMRETVCHEMGHVLGLRHNFIASTYHSLSDLRDGSLVARTGVSSSVMDYEPFNVEALKRKGVDYYTRVVGPYDIWAILYGYTDGDASKLTGIAAQCNLPGHQYQSDEIADQFDPAVTRFDLGRDPLAYYQRMFDVSRYLIVNLDKRLPRKGETYWKFTQAFNRLLGIQARIGALTTRYVGGLHVNRNHRGDAGEKPTLAPIDAAEQRRALQLLNTYIFSESAFAFPKSYFTRLTANPFMGFAAFLGGTTQDFPVFDQIAGLQSAALRQLFNPGVLRRVANNEFKLADPAHAFSMPSLFHSVAATVWSELPARANVSALRRQLQRNHLDAMIRMAVSTGGAPEDAKLLAWDQLRQLKVSIRAAKASRLDEYTRLHLDQSLLKIERALEAKMTIDSNG